MIKLVTKSTSVATPLRAIPTAFRLPEVLSPFGHATGRSSFIEGGRSCTWSL